MRFILSKVLWLLLSPGNLLFLLLLLGLVLQWRGIKRLGRTLIALILLLAVAVIALPVGDWLATPLETRFAAPPLPAKVDGIIVLGGAVSPDRTLAHGRPAVSESVDRMISFVDLARRYPEARLVFTGGNGELFPADLSEAEVARRLFAEMAPDLTRIEFEGKSRNTFENALFSFAQVKPQPGETWLMITSAAHMPRAVGCFRHVGWAVIPWPVDYRTGEAHHYDLAGNLNMIGNAVREWTGLLAYRVNGYTDALFPAP